MKPNRIGMILSATLLAAVVAGCGSEAEPEVAAPAVEETSTAETGEDTPSTEAAPTTDAPTTPPPTTEEPTSEEPTAEEPTTEESTEPTTEAAAPTTEDAQEPTPEDAGLPTSVEEYAEAYLRAGTDGDQELLERMGSDEAIQASVTWIGLEWDRPKVRDGLNEGEVFVSYVSPRYGDNVYGLSLKIDRAAAEAGQDDAVLAGEAGDAILQRTPEEYADELIRLWQEARPYSGSYMTAEVAAILEAELVGGTWERTDSTEEADLTLVRYVNVETGRELVLTLNSADVQAGSQQGVIDASFGVIQG